jgi:hypothetical protein
MNPVHYNRQTNNKIYYFGIITIPEIFIMIIIGMVDIMLFKSATFMLVAMFAYMAYLGCFRVGKPNGYDVHFFKSLFTPKIFRPGKLDSLPHIKIK